MRKLILALVLASAAATPALADPQSDRAAREAAQAEREAARAEREAARAERQQVREERQQASRQEHVAPQPQPQVQAQPRSVERTERIEQRNVDRAARDAARAERQAERNQITEQRRDAVQRHAARPSTPPVVSVTPRPGTQPPPPTAARTTPVTSWNTNWRHNSRYNWYDWRRRHRSWFHLGFYFDPFGWGYSPYQIGWRMWPSYYSSRYWINDPWYYRLPYAPPGYRWIRYYDDALLIDTWSGEVVDVIYNFFW
jgi:hypothetical protein